ncbi:MAG: 4Fe-4S dicluster domain-containing protein [Ruminococcaceae bacterium]|nr:4Fe-4S dicluster domain-containing protein [Oscillospiraceae bacterium]
MEICKFELCTGCTACAAVCPVNCISFKADEKGFLRPVIYTGRCISCGLCQKTCPVMNKNESESAQPKFYAAYAKDDAVRIKSTSGGVFSEIAGTILEENGAVFGAAYDENFAVRHICAENETELNKLRGAKYSQSDLGDTFKNVKERLEKGQKVLFSGTPCQVGGLVSFLKKDYENLLTVDVVCHSVPSPMAWVEYIKYRARLDNEGVLPENINLRSKNTGWSRYAYSNLFDYGNGKKSELKSHESLFMKLFVGGYITRKSCENCQFKGYNHKSDITLGDFWGVWDVLPEMDDNKGTSLVFLNSDSGRKVFEKISGRICFKEVSEADALAQNSAVINSIKPNPRREEAFELIRNGNIALCENWFKEKKPSLIKRVISRAKRIVKRIIKSK